jgi:hypothetical protein
VDILLSIFQEISILISIEFSGLPVRLQGPSSASGSGRVEVFYNGQWGTICDGNWDKNDATVVCHQLGYQCAVRAIQGSNVPNGTGQIWMNEVRCTGRKQNLISCSHSGWGSNNCTHNEDGGVECCPRGNLLYGFKAFAWCTHAYE